MPRRGRTLRQAWCLETYGPQSHTCCAPCLRGRRRKTWARGLRRFFASQKATLFAIVHPSCGWQDRGIEHSMER
eukprot:15475017-Alexandrium_andersonii.AAC.1